MKRIRWTVGAALVLAAVGGAAWWLSRPAPPTAFPEEYRFEPVKIVTTVAALVEMPEADDVTLVGAGARALAGYFENAGLAVVTNAADVPRTDIVVVSGAEKPDWKRLAAQVSDDGELVWLLDVRQMTAGAFKRALAAMPGEDVHLWMPGENDWVLTARQKAVRRDLGDMLEVFSRESAFADLAKAECETLPDLLANYVGTREEVAPALVGDLRQEIRPEFLVPQEIPTIGWIDADNVDADINEMIGQQFHSVQFDRRTVLEGNILARDRAQLPQAFDKWAAALRHNPHDTLLLGRLHSLAVNAATFLKVGNVKAAAHCYEAMIAIRPTDAAAISEYGKCQLMLGNREVADQAKRRAEELIK